MLYQFLLNILPMNTQQHLRHTHHHYFFPLKNLARPPWNGKEIRMLVSESTLVQVVEGLFIPYDVTSYDGVTTQQRLIISSHSSLSLFTETFPFQYTLTWTHNFS